MTYYTKKLHDGRILLLHGATPVAVYPDITKANQHARIVTGKDAKPAVAEVEPQIVQPEPRPRGRPKKAKDK